MASTTGSRTQHRVLFANLDPVVEDQKIERRAEKVLDKKKKRALQKMNDQKRNDDVRFFLCYLQILNREQLCQEKAANGIDFLSRSLFPTIHDDQVRLVAFFDVVDSLKLPGGTKQKIKGQLNYLHTMMNCWIDNGWYDWELDRFLQFLRLSTGQRDLLSDFMMESFKTEDRDAIRNMTIRMLKLGVGRTPSRDCSDADKVALQNLVAHLIATHAYDCGLYASSTGSSGESSGSDDEEEHWIDI